MEKNEIKTPEDIFTYMNEHIQYGWMDAEGIVHQNEMKEFRKKYRTMSIEDSIKNGVGTCIEQVYLMHHLLNQIHVINKMFCCRIYEPDEYNDFSEDEHMHCFLLYYQNNKVYQLEHPNVEKAGIYEYENEAIALKEIETYYVELRGGKKSPTTQFYKVDEGLTFQQFNAYINHVVHK